MSHIIPDNGWDIDFGGHTPDDPPVHSGPHHLSSEYFLCYCIILPIVSIIGISGNVVNLVVLAGDSFRGFMFTYMRVLSVTDIAYLLFTIQVKIALNA